MDRIPPSQIEAEQAVLSAVLLDNDALITCMEQLYPEDFYVEKHRVIFGAMREMFEQGTPVDLVTLTDHLQATARLDLVGGPAAVSGLAGRVSTAANVSYWAGIVRDKALLRNLITEATSIITEAYGEPVEVEDFLDRAEAKILDVASRQTGQTYQPMSRVMEESFHIIEELDKRKGALTGIPTGFHALDELTSGFQKGEMILLAGRPSMGKTALALNFIRHAALEAEKTVAFFSLEMAANQLALRMICAEAAMPMQRLKFGNFKKSQWRTLINAANALSQAGIFIEDSAALSILELKAKARRIKAEHGLDMVVVDYLQLLAGTGSRKSRDSREQEIAEISRGMKGMAKELDIPVLALSQLNRAPEAREGGEPRLSDLRESGSLEQDADVVMLLHRPGLYKKKEEGVEESDSRTKLKIEKQRNGPIGVVDLMFLKDIQKFEPFEGIYDKESYPESSG